MSKIRHADKNCIFLPDSKSQITLEYRDGIPQKASSIVGGRLMSLVPLSRLPLVAPGSLFCCALLRCDVVEQRVAL